MISEVAISERAVMLKRAKAERNKRACRSHLLPFTKATFPKFNPTWFHRSYYQKLNDFAHGRIKKLMVFVPPQHGKSEGSTRRLPAFLLGRDPDRRIAIVCYSSTKAKKFSREIQRIMDDPLYHEIFPDTQLSDGSDGFAKTGEEFEVKNHLGGVRAVGVGGPLTGETVDILIMDDLYKDAKEAYSELIRENIQEWYDTVAESRLHNDSQQLIVFTRWHHQDLAGRLLESEGADWEVVVYPALKVGKPSDIDPRLPGEPLYPEKHGVEKLEKIKARNPLVFESLYQQDPKPKKGLLYSEFKTYKTIPFSKYQIRKAYVDTADTGDDYLCSIAYVETEIAMYVLDIYYTQDAMETTEPETALQLSKHQVQVAKIESNNGGRGFARNVETQMRLAKNHATQVTWFHQTDNKQVRIFTNSAKVTNLILMPEGWEQLFPAFYTHVTSYSAKGKNTHDDAEDALTGMVEDFGNVPTTPEDMEMLSVFG